MSLSINTNVFSLGIQRNLARHNRALGRSFQRLSSGLRINGAADDAAGLAISERLRSQIRGSQAAQRNATFGISIVQTAEGSLNETSDILIQLRELAIQSSNGTLSDADRDTLQEEFGALRAEVDRISQATRFSDLPILAEDGTFDILLGSGLNLNAETYSLELEAVSTTSLGIESLDISSGGDQATAIEAIDTAINSVSSFRGRLGATQFRFESRIRSLSTLEENLSAADSRIRDVDIAKEQAELVRNQILQQVAVSLLSQANQQPALVLQLLQF